MPSLVQVPAGYRSVYLHRRQLVHARVCQSAWSAKLVTVTSH